MRARTIQNVVVNSLGTVISMVAGLLVMPFLIRQLGNSGYGLWTLIGTLTGYFGVLDLGVGSAVGRLIAGYLARGEFERINAIISTGLSLLIGVALFVMLCTFGAIPVFFMSWAYADKPEMTAQLAEAYTVAGNANNALVIPAGLAFARALSEQPELNLYVADKRHPTLAGTYLAACVVFAALTGRSPVGNPYLAGIDAPTAHLLQTVAWETVQDYYGK